MSSQSVQPETARQQQCYLYAIIDVDENIDQLIFPGEGLGGSDVYAILSEDQQRAAIVCGYSGGKVRPQRRSLASHNSVLNRLMNQFTVLPMSFGMLADDEDAVRQLLQDNSESFDEHLQKVRGSWEMVLRVHWDVDNVYDYLLSVHPELRQLRDRMFQDGREPSHEEKIELGRQFERVLESHRESDTQRMTEAIEGACLEIAHDNPRNECEVMNLAVLVHRDRISEFESVVEQAAGRFDENYVIAMNGPWPPHHFVNLELQLSS